MGHRNICCDGCQRLEFRGRRFRCMRCMNYDLCGDCYDQRIETQAHSVDHPMQLIPEPGQESGLERGQEPGLLGGGTLELVHLPNCYTCPYCGLLGYTGKQLIKHVYEQHRLSEDYVVCPMCAGVPSIELLAVRNLSRHLLLNHVEQANQMEPGTPPLRRILTRSSQRFRRRRQLQLLTAAQQQLSRESPAILPIDDVTVPLHLPVPQDLQEPQGRTENEEIVFPNAEPSASAKQSGEGFLLVPWVAEQERRCRETERAVTQKRRHALFAEHLLLSMLSAEELQLPERKSTPERSPKHQQGLSKVMSLMSLPWTRLRQVSQWEGSGLRGADEVEDQAAWMDRAKAGTEEEEAID